MAQNGQIETSHQPAVDTAAPVCAADRVGVEHSPSSACSEGGCPWAPDAGCLRLDERRARRRAVLVSWPVDLTPLPPEGEHDPLAALLNARVTFGLTPQRREDIQARLDRGENWPEIARAVGWHQATLEAHWTAWLERPKPTGADLYLLGALKKLPGRWRATERTRGHGDNAQRAVAFSNGLVRAHAEVRFGSAQVRAIFAYAEPKKIRVDGWWADVEDERDMRLAYATVLTRAAHRLLVLDGPWRTLSPWLDLGDTLVRLDRERQIRAELLAEDVHAWRLDRASLHREDLRLRAEGWVLLDAWASPSSTPTTTPSGAP
jgi:hypothetical protein